MSTIKPTSVPSKRLSETISGSALSFKLNNIEGWDGVDLAAADFGTVAYAVFRNSAGTLMEIMEIDPSTIAGASITINKRGLKFTGDLSTEVAANKLTWIRGDTIVELGSHPPQLFNSYVDLYNEQTITGMKSVPTPTASGHIATKGYVDTLAFGGTGKVDQIVEAGNAGETVAAGNLLYFDTTDNEWKKTDADTLATIFGVKLGIAQGAGTDGAAISGGVLTRGLDTNQTGMTQGDIMFASNTAGGIGSTTGTIPRVIGIARTATTLYFDPDYLRFPYIYAADSVGTDSYAVTVPEAFNAYFVGMELTIKVGTANTGSATLAVNGGAAKTIKKNVSDDLETGDLLANQIIKVVYDGTNFQLLTNRFKKTTIQIFASSGTYTKPNGVVALEVVCIGGGGGGGRGNGTSGAGGGGGGGRNFQTLNASLIAATESVTVGTGGAGASANNTNGTDGNPSSFGAFVKAYGGIGGLAALTGGAGGTGAGAGSAAATASTVGGAGGGSGHATDTGSAGGAGGLFGAGGGGGGGGSSSQGPGSAGGAQATRGTTIAGGTGGSSPGGNGGAATDISANEIYGGAGGGGGAGNGAGAGGAGAAGGKYGGGGGGGGGGSTTSGNGGAGANGVVAVIEYY